MRNYRGKCGIVTFHSSHNYGSVLQAYAMVNTMQKIGFDTELIDFRHPHTTAVYEWQLWSPYKNWRWNIKDFVFRGILGVGKKREEVFRDFIDNVLPKSHRVTHRTEIPDKYDVLICGSDQIWNKVSTGENDPVYFLDFGTTSCKFSYAASSGSTKFGEECHCQMEKYLKGLKAIGVREQFMKRYIRDEFNLNAVVNPDPTFLISKGNWIEIEKPYPNIPARYLLLYTLVKQKETRAFALQVAKKMRLPLVEICNSNKARIAKVKRGNFFLNDVSPQQFLWLFHHAAFVVTNTFHGNMFSVIFRKNFVHYDINANDTRISTLHDAIGFGHTRMVKDIIEISNNEIDYSAIEERIKDYAGNGLSFIKENIKAI